MYIWLYSIGVKNSCKERKSEYVLSEHFRHLTFGHKFSLKEKKFMPREKFVNFVKYSSWKRRQQRERHKTRCCLNVNEVSATRHSLSSLSIQKIYSKQLHCASFSKSASWKLLIHLPSFFSFIFCVPRYISA